MEYTNLIFEVSEGILTITLNRPKQLNALNLQLFAELKSVFETVYKSDEIKAVIITGSGEKAFAAGADIKEFAAFNSDEGAEMSQSGQDIFRTIETCPKPVLAAVNGMALGGGCELAMACHLRIASENAKFSQPEVGLGVTPGYGGTQRLPMLIGKTKALELLLTGEMLGAEDAKHLGLVNYVVPQADLLATCRNLLQKIMAKSPVAVRGIIRAVNAFYDKGIGNFDAEIHEFSTCFDSEDFKEGTTAFVEKRKPAFTGK